MMRMNVNGKTIDEMDNNAAEDPCQTFIHCRGLGPIHSFKQTPQRLAY